MLTNIYPGINKYVKLDFFTEEERRIVEKLSHEFYITNAAALAYKNSTYRYCFVKLTDNYRHIFRAEGELIVLFSAYDNFENRTLSALDSIVRETSTRLDKICALVISKDQNFRNKLADLAKQNNEMWTIAPFIYSEFKNKAPASFFKERISSHFFLRDLFDVESPLREERYFFGRDQIVHALVEKHLQTENSGVFGLRRSGKTSILYAVKRLAEARGSIASIVDGQTLNVRTWNSALLYIIKTLNKENHAHIIINENQYDTNQAADSFENDVAKIFYKLQKRILILVDEVEHITFEVSGDKNWNSGDSYLKFWQIIRSVFNKHKNQMTFLISGTNPRCVEKPFVGKTDNPLFGQLHPEYIEPFDVRLTTQMVQALGGHMALEFPDEVCTYLTRDYGGHPFLIRQVCSSIHRKLLKSGVHSHASIDRSLYNECRSEFDAGKGLTYCEMIVGILSEFYPDEYHMLTMLASGDIDDFENLAQSDPTYTEHLLGYGILEKTSKSYDFKMDVLKKYLSGKHQYKSLNLNFEEKRSEISLRRNRVEQELRELVKKQLLFLFGKDEAKSKMLARVESAKRSRLATLEYADFFNPDKNDIYFNDLVELMKIHWEKGFRNLFDENVERFNSRMILLNSIGRGDAHAKNINEADFLSFRGAMGWLEEKLKDM